MAHSNVFLSAMNNWRNAQQLVDYYEDFRRHRYVPPQRMITQTSSSSGTSLVNQQSASTSSSSSDSSQNTRETGCVDKLCKSYGFISTVDRPERVFFHFSQLQGIVGDQMCVGDTVKFSITRDRRTGKTIACNVVKVQRNWTSLQRVFGIVTQPLNTLKMNGRISYEDNGEHFFLSFDQSCMENRNIKLRVGDKISFEITALPKGQVAATQIRLESTKWQRKHRGTIRALKESFGFIEREKQQAAMFFHFSEAEANAMLEVGDSVEFTIERRNGREFACNVVQLVDDSLKTIDIDGRMRFGQVVTPINCNKATLQQRRINSGLKGALVLRTVNQMQVKLHFGIKDLASTCTLHPYDFVNFHIATDRRNQQVHATAVKLMPAETFNQSSEQREQGVVYTLRSGNGTICCVQRNMRMYFAISELVDDTCTIAVNDEVEFTASYNENDIDKPNYWKATRVVILPANTVQLRTFVVGNIQGVVTHLFLTQDSASENAKTGIISYRQGNDLQTIKYNLKSWEKPCNWSDHVTFDIYFIKHSKEHVACNVKTIQPHLDRIGPELKVDASSNNNGTNIANIMKQAAIKAATDHPVQFVERGYISGLNEISGFIERESHDDEIFFEFTELKNSCSSLLQLGLEVEYTLTRYSSKIVPKATHVRILPQGSIPQAPILDKWYEGIVTREMRSTLIAPALYAGTIQIINDKKHIQYKFGITSLMDKKNILRKDNKVKFCIDETGHAVNVCPILI